MGQKSVKFWSWVERFGTYGHHDPISPTLTSSENYIGALFKDFWVCFGIYFWYLSLILIWMSSVWVLVDWFGWFWLISLGWTSSTNGFLGWFMVSLVDFRAFIIIRVILVYIMAVILMVEINFPGSSTFPVK